MLYIYEIKVIVEATQEQHDPDSVVEQLLYAGQLRDGLPEGVKAVWAADILDEYEE